MTDALDVLKTRRSVPPAFLAEPGPSAAQLTTLLTVAARVPDHGKLQPWRFIVYGGEARAKAGRIILDAFKARNPHAEGEALKKEETRFTVAPIIIGVVSTAAEHAKIPLWEQELSAGAVCQNLVTAATAQGFGASWLTGWFAYDRDVLAQLGIRPNERVAGFVHIGTPREQIPDRPRPVLAEIVSYFS